MGRRAQGLGSRIGGLLDWLAEAVKDNFVWNNGIIIRVSGVQVPPPLPNFLLKHSAAIVKRRIFAAHLYRDNNIDLVAVTPEPAMFPVEFGTERALDPVDPRPFS